MKVILLQDVKSQGKKDQIIEVSDGYANNFLFPKKLAVEANANNLNTLKLKQDAQKRKVDAERADAKAVGAKIEASTVVIKLSAGGDGRPQGAVTSKDISETLKSSLGVDVDKRKIVLDSPIKAYGTYKIDVKLYAEVSCKLTLMITEK